ncbi:MAG: pyruvate, phosphate dikinase [Solirubrobacterales bacterium]|nr:pyruvate, phosphate dikinase [Solirubrobacterales bacterium]
MTTTKFVYEFGSGTESPRILGGKGASLARMTNLGLPIPPGFVIGTGAYQAWAEADADAGEIPAGLLDEIAEGIDGLERAIGRRLGEVEDPLLVSVRSGAPVSMPGMMDTLLNVGLNDETIAALAERTAPEFAWDIYVRLLATYAEVVRGIKVKKLGDAIDPAAPAPELAEAWKRVIAEHGEPFPQSPRRQIEDGVIAVWKSWDSPRAKRYRRFAGISDSLGTGVTVQAMVFGNRDERSGTGVVFTRDPGTGTPGAYGDFLLQAQGEDVVAGSHDPEPIQAAGTRLPEAFAKLEEALPVLEASYRDMCDIEFTIETDKLWILQARVGQRSGAAAVRIAVDLVDQGLIDIETALERVPLSALEDLQRPVFAADQEFDLLGSGAAASPGAAIGKAVFTSQFAEEMAEQGEDVILVRPETSPADIGGMIASKGIVTALGGRASHAAVVARGIGRPAICGVNGLVVDEEAGTATTAEGRVIREGDLLSVDGHVGRVMAGAVAMAPSQPDPRLAQLLAWCEERRRIPILTEAPAGHDVVADMGDTARAGSKVLVDLPWEGSDSAKLLERVVSELNVDADRELVLALPESLCGVDLRPPASAWSAIVTAGDNEWAASLLSARIELTEEGQS